jgi:hypothetical protein
VSLPGIALVSYIAGEGHGGVLIPGTEASVNLRASTGPCEQGLSHEMSNCFRKHCFLFLIIIIIINNKSLFLLRPVCCWFIKMGRKKK